MRNCFGMFCFVLVLTLIARSGFAQKTDDTYPEAKISEKELYRFDIARPVKHFDALPDGSDWFAVDEFALMQTMIIRGERFERRFNEIPKATARFSPNGDYMIWMGLERSFDSKGFNTTTTTVFKSTKASTTPDSVGRFTSDYNTLYFSRSGMHWAATLPAANVYQKGLRDVVLYDGLVISKGNPLPGMFSFDKTETGWAYRSTDGRDENLVTPYALQKMYTKAKINPYVESSDPIVYHFSPDLKTTPNQLESRDYDFDFRTPAELYKTTYLPSRQDTAHSYIIFSGKRQPNFRWISNIQIDTGGKHIVYFAGDTTGERQGLTGNNKRSIVIEDGKAIAGPYEETGRLFISPSGKNVAWSARKDTKPMLFLNGKVIGEVGNYIDLYWSPDEKKIAYLTNDEKGKNFIVAGGKRSPKFDRIGRVGFSSDGKSVEFCAINYDKLLQIRQPF